MRWPFDPLMSKILEIWKAFGDLTGRYYNPIETYQAEDAETLLVTMGSCGETASVAVDRMREEGRAVGLVKIRLWRPFPFEAFKKATLKAKQLVVIDRAVSVGGPWRPCRIGSEGCYLRRGEKTIGLQLCRGNFRQGCDTVRLHQDGG